MTLVLHTKDADIPNDVFSIRQLNMQGWTQERTAGINSGVSAGRKREVVWGLDGSAWKRVRREED